MNTNLRTLGPHEANVILSLREQGREVVHAADIIGLLGYEPRARKVIRNLIRKGWLARLVGGRYMLLPPERGPENLGENNPIALAAAAAEPSYVGWWSAAAFHGFTTQKPMKVTVATQRQMPTRTIEGTEVQFIKIVARKFSGFKTYTIYGRKVAITDPEKTVVDCIDRPDLAGGSAELTRIVYTAMGEIDHEKLVTEAMAMKSTALLQRLGFLTDLVGRKLPEKLRLQVRNAIPKSTRSIFGRRDRREGDIGYAADWGLFVYARQNDLLAEVPRIKGEGGESC
jgi:predicted transcriptional regulator of viral defense system